MENFCCRFGILINCEWYIYMTMIFQHNLCLQVSKCLKVYAKIELAVTLQKLMDMVPTYVQLSTNVCHAFSNAKFSE